MFERVRCCEAGNNIVVHHMCFSLLPVWYLHSAHSFEVCHCTSWASPALSYHSIQGQGMSTFHKYYYREQVDCYLAFQNSHITFTVFSSEMTVPRLLWFRIKNSEWLIWKLIFKGHGTFSIVLHCLCGRFVGMRRSKWHLQENGA